MTHLTLPLHPESLLIHLEEGFLQVVGMAEAPEKKGSVRWHLVGVSECSGVHICLHAVGEEREAMPETAAAVYPDHLHAA